MYIIIHVHCIILPLLTDGPNPLVVPLESTSVSKARRTRLWFSQPGIQGMLGGMGEGEGEGEEEEERTVKAFKEKGGQLWEKEKTGEQGRETEKKGEM